MKRKRSIFLIFALIIGGVILGLSNLGWAAVDEVKTFGLVESGTLTETTNFNDGSVVYVRIKTNQQGSTTPYVEDRVIITDQGPSSKSITITVYDDGTFPDDKYNDGYYWGKFTLREGDGSGTDDTNDILEVEDGQTAEIEADIDGDTNSGIATITAAYSTFSDHTPPGIVSLSVNPSPFSPNGDGINDTTTVSFTLGDTSSQLYTRIEVRDSSDKMVRNLLVPADGDNPLSPGSYSKTWDGDDDNGVRVGDGTYTIYIISLDESMNSTLRTIDVTVDTESPEIAQVNVSPETISPENTDGNFDSAKITFKATHTEGGLNFKIKKDSTYIRDLSSNITWETDHYTVTWDGKNNDGAIVDDGEYVCEIVATNSVSTSTTDTTGRVTVDNTSPPPPMNLQATAISGGKIKLTWTASSPEDDVAHYNIYRATTSGGENFSSPTYTVSAGTTTYTDTSTTNGQTYYYIVRAEDAVKNMETNTNEVLATASSEGPSFISITADKSSYKNGDTITLTIQLANQNYGCTLTADFSNIDDQYETGMESFTDWASDGKDNDGDGHIDEDGEKGYYNITYTISPINKKADGNYSIPVTATDPASNSCTSSITLTLDNSGPTPPSPPVSPSFVSISSDKNAYANGDTITLTIQLANQNYGCTLTADFSNIDDQYETGMESFTDWASDGKDNDGDGHIDEDGEKGYYNITYTISPINKKADGDYSILVTATNASGSSSSSITLTLDNTTPIGEVSQACIKYDKNILYNLLSSTNIDSPNVFSNSKIDEIYILMNLQRGIAINKTSSNITLYKIIERKPYGPETEEVKGVASINQGEGWAEFIFYPDPIFNPGEDEHQRDGLYWVKVDVVNTLNNTGELNFYFTYDTVSPLPPDIYIKSFNPGTGMVELYGDTESYASVEVFVNGYSTGTAMADDEGNFTKNMVYLKKGVNYLKGQAADRAGNKSNPSKSLKLEYNPARLLSIVIRSNRIVRPGNPVTIIYSVTDSAEVTLRIFNLKGGIVKEKSESVFAGEEKSWNWYGDNMINEEVNNGVYILKIIAQAGDKKNSFTALLGVLR